MVDPRPCLCSVPGHGLNVFFIISFIVVVQKPVRKARLFSLLLDGENMFGTWAVTGQIPICSKDLSPRPTQEGLVPQSDLPPNILPPRGSQTGWNRSCAGGPAAWRFSAGWDEPFLSCHLVPLRATLSRSEGGGGLAVPGPVRAVSPPPCRPPSLAPSGQK